MTFSPPTPPRRKRSRSVNYFALAVLYLGVVNLIRAWLALGGQPYIRTLNPIVPLSYLAASAIVWGILFVVAAWGIWRLRSWARILLLGAIIVYQVHIWVNHALFDTSIYARQLWPFQAGISVASVIVVWAFMFLPGIRKLYSSESREGI